MRVVLDTNQHVSAIIRPNENPVQIVQLWHIGLIELAISPSILKGLPMIGRQQLII